MKNEQDRQLIIIDAATVSDGEEPNSNYKEMTAIDSHFNNENNALSLSGAAAEGEESLYNDGDDTNQQQPPRTVQQHLQQQQHHLKTSTPLATGFVLCCNIVGGGVLSLPTAFADSSLVVGIFLLFGNAFVTVLNLRFIVEVADQLNEYDYCKILQRGLGPMWSKVALLNLTIFPAGALIGYTRIIADSIPPVLISFFGASKESFITKDYCWILIGGIVFFTLSCRRTLSEMFTIAVFGLVTIFFAVLCVVIRFFDGSYRVQGSTSLVDPAFSAAYLSPKMFQTIPIICFSLSVHNNMPAYYQELENRSPAKMMSVVYRAHVIILAAYLVTGVCGLMNFGNVGSTGRLERAKGNIMDAYSEDDTLINVCRSGLFIHFATVYPLLLLACRRYLFILIHGGSVWLPMRKIVLATFCITLAACLIASVTPNIADVLSVNGSVSGSIVMLIVPSILYLRLVGSQTEGWNNRLKIGAVSSIVYGVVVGILGLIVTFTSNDAPSSAAIMGNSTNSSNISSSSTQLLP